jgi:hypothetical protein
MRHQIKKKRTRSMLRIELNRTCRLGSPDGERSRTDLSLRVLKMLANVAAIAGARRRSQEILHRR